MNLRKKIMTSLLAATVACSMVFTGCGPSDSAQSSGSGSGSGPAQLFLLTGSTGGTYYALGGAMANVWNQAIPDKVKVTAQSSGASVENMKRLDAGEAQIALAMNNIAEAAWNGTGVFDKKLTHFRAVGVVYPEVLQGIADADSGIKSVKDLAGKTVAVGPTGSGTAVLLKDVFEDLGMPFDKFNPEYIGFGDASSRMKDGHLDANFAVLAVPASAIQDITTTRKINIIEFKGDDLAKLQAKYPFMSPFKIPAGTYGNAEDAWTVSMKCVLYCRDDLPEDVVYNLVKTFYEKNADIAAAHAAGKYIQLDTALEGITTPLHAGAAKYYQEKGIAIPDAIAPTK